MKALGKHLLACRAVPLLVLVVGDLALDEQLCELSALRFALEGHQVEANKRKALGPATSQENGLPGGLDPVGDADLAATEEVGT